LKTLYLQCNNGISGDMTVGALLDLGANEAKLRKLLASTNLSDEFEITVERKVISSIDTCSFDVLYGKRLHQGENKGQPCDHEHKPDHDDQCDHDHKPGHDHPCDHEHKPGHDHQCDHDHKPGHDHKHGHKHRNLSDVNAIIDQIDSEEAVKQLAKRIFKIVAEAESKAHGKPIKDVHFHEVGAIDSIIDIISVAFCIHDLGIEKVMASPLTDGSGEVKCQHGIIPVPVPAVINTATAYQIPIQMTDFQGEMVTPTGAAIIAALEPTFETPKMVKLKKVGLGSGKRYPDRPNFLRAMLFEGEEAHSDRVCKLEANLDDCTGEQLGYAMEVLMDAGALDVYFTPIQMKKNRPAHMLSVLCQPEAADHFETLIFATTTTLGVRKSLFSRHCLGRQKEEIQTPYGPVQAKVVTVNGKRRFYPEYQEIIRLIQETGESYYKILTTISKEE